MQLKRNKEMVFETLKKSHKKQIIIGAIAVCVIGGALTFSLTRAKYEVANDLELAKGTINYKAYDFKIMAMYKSDDKINYTEIEEMPSEGYVINESKSYCNMSNGNKDTKAILKTIDGNHSISKLKKNDKCFIYFDKKTPKNVSELVAASIKGSGTPDFSKTSCSDGCDENTVGIYEANDGMYGGTSYYWRGDAIDNYIIFADKCWRIVRINGDSTIRIIYGGTSCHANGERIEDSIAVQNVTYNDKTGRSEYVGWTYTEGQQRGNTVDSDIKVEVNNWYNSNIENDSYYVSKVAKGKFCNDRETLPEYPWASIPNNDIYFASYDRLVSKYKPSFDCSKDDIYVTDIGVITGDEVNFSGGKYGSSNILYYLYNGKSYWTMSPMLFLVANDKFNYPYVIFIFSNGSYNWGQTYGTSGLRPVINLRSDVTFSGGDGTLNNPYIVS